MKPIDYIRRLDLMSYYVERKCTKKGWELIESNKTDATFYYTQPLSRWETFLKRPNHPAIMVHVEIDDYGHFTERIINQR